MKWVIILFAALLLVVLAVLLVAYGACFLCASLVPEPPDTGAPPDDFASYPSARNVTINIDVYALKDQVKIYPSSSESIEIKSWRASIPTIASRGDSENLSLTIKYLIPHEGDFGHEYSTHHIFLPPNACYDIRIKNSDGDVYVTGINATSLTIDNYRGKVGIEECAFGELHVRNYGPIYARYRANESYLESYNARTPNFTFPAGSYDHRLALKGTIDVNFSFPAGSHEVKSDFGNIGVTIPPEGEATVNATAYNGNITLGRPMELSVNEPGHIVGRITGSSPQNFSIAVHTVNYDVQFN